MSLDVYLHDPTSTYCTDSLFWGNVTHNMGIMADKAGIYKALWRPEEIGAKYAKDIIGVVEKGLYDLNTRPEYFKQFNPYNGWGNYEGFIEFVEKYLLALKEYPDAVISISR